MKKFLKKVKEDKISECSAESSYYIILSIIPFLLVFISLIQYINIDKSTLIYYAKQIIPKTFQDISLNIIEEIFSKTITTLSFSIIFAIWSASRGFFSIMKGIGEIYKSEESYLKNKFRAILFTILFIMLLVLTLVILVIGGNVGNIAFCVTIFLIFTLFYKFILNNNAKIRNQIKGALFATFAWYALSYAFSLYIEINQGFSLLYGSLSTIILFMLWTYYLIYAILIGAEINFYFSK